MTTAQNQSIVGLLIAERDKLSKAIEALTGNMPKKRGRPPKNPLALVLPTQETTATATATHTHRRPRTDAQRKAQAERMRAYWSKRRAATAPPKPAKRARR